MNYPYCKHKTSISLWKEVMTHGAFDRCSVVVSKDESIECILLLYIFREERRRVCRGREGVWRGDGAGGLGGGLRVGKVSVLLRAGSDINKIVQSKRFNVDLQIAKTTIHTSLFRMKMFSKGRGIYATKIIFRVQQISCTSFNIPTISGVNRFPYLNFKKVL